MPDPLFSLQGKTALVTGGSSGIGRMIAAGLVRRGVKTYVTSRSAEHSGLPLRGDPVSMLGSVDEVPNP